MRFIHRIAVCLPVLIGTLTAQYAEDAVRPFWGLGNPASRASGLGETFTGIADDGTALFYNPGGLGNLDKAELNLGLNHLIVTTDIQVSSTGDNYPSTINTTRLGNLVMAFPVPEAKITVAGGYHLAYAFERDWAYQNQAPGDGEATTEQVSEQGQLGVWSLGLGHQVTPGIALGGAVEFLSGQYHYDEQNTFPEYDSVDVFQIKPTYRGIGVSAGVVLAPFPFWRFGILLRSPWDINVEEESYEIGYGWETREYRTRSPFSVRMGTSVSLGPLLLAGDLILFDYSQVRLTSDLVDYDGTPIDIYVNSDLRHDYLSTLGYALGVEYLLPGINLKLRGGYRYYPSMTQVNPNDYVRQSFSLGTSLVTAPQIKLDAAYTVSVWDRSYSVWTEQNNAGLLSANLVFRF